MQMQSPMPEFGLHPIAVGLTECVCLQCLHVLGRASTPQAIRAVEKAHRCPAKTNLSAQQFSADPLPEN